MTTVDLRNALLAPKARGGRCRSTSGENFLGSSLDDRTVDPDRIVETVEIDRHDIAAVLAEVKPDLLVCDIEGAEADCCPPGTGPACARR